MVTNRYIIINRGYRGPGTQHAARCCAVGVVTMCRCEIHDDSPGNGQFRKTRRPSHCVVLSCGVGSFVCCIIRRVMRARRSRKRVTANSHVTLFFVASFCKTRIVWCREIREPLMRLAPPPPPPTSERTTRAQTVRREVLIDRTRAIYRIVNQRTTRKRPTSAKC